jgi:hypothetical protein
MAIHEFDREPLSQRDKGFIRMRSIMDYGMGVLWTGMGIFFIFIKHFNTMLAVNYDDPVIKIFGGVCILYGFFRIYRGYKKNYVRER